jgi:hypothetical protein
MRTVIISDNPLFAEVMNETVAGYACALTSFKTSDPISRLSEFKPQLVILDETAKEMAEGLIAVCHLLACRIILVNLRNNDLVILDSEMRTVSNMGHMKEAMLLEALNSSEERRR